MIFLLIGFSVFEVQFFFFLNPQNSSKGRAQSSTQYFELNYRVFQPICLAGLHLNSVPSQTVSELWPLVKMIPSSSHALKFY